ncbi:MAG: hypothetical protein R3A52_05965 [Polyangiales bacterium]
MKRVSLLACATLSLGLAACSAEPDRWIPVRDSGTSGTLDGGRTSCDPSQIYCNGNETYTCAEDGTVLTRQTCSGATPICAPGVGCRVCVPGTSRCDPSSPNRAQTCAPDGRSYSDGIACNEADGEMCVSGACVSRCSDSALGRSYLGCDYWPTVTANGALDPNFTFAVVLSNPQTYAVREHHRRRPHRPAHGEPLPRRHRDRHPALGERPRAVRPALRARPRRRLPRHRPAAHVDPAPRGRVPRAHQRPHRRVPVQPAHLRALDGLLLVHQ